MSVELELEMELETIIEVIRYSGKCGYCGRELYPSASKSEAEGELMVHECDCPYNPRNQACATCKHWDFARQFPINDEEFLCGNPNEEYSKNIRECNYVGSLVDKRTTGCNHWAKAQDEEE